jgi:hypothetical protein
MTHSSGGVLVQFIDLREANSAAATDAAAGERALDRLIAAPRRLHQAES